MKEVIYTIPVNEAFDKLDGRCPFCILYDMLQSNEIETILGASMMEPDIRIKTNELGFCGRHYDMMFERKNRLQLALMLESHLESVSAGIRPGGILSRDAGQKPVSYITRLESDCYVCSRIDHSLSKMFETTLLLWSREKEFKNKFDAQKFFCLPHYRRLMEYARQSLPKGSYSEFVKCADNIESSYLEALRADVSHFIRKFDYRYESEPWGNAKDSVERALRFLKGDQ